MPGCNSRAQGIMTIKILRPNQNNAKSTTREGQPDPADFFINNLGDHKALDNQAKVKVLHAAVLKEAIKIKSGNQEE